MEPIQVSSIIDQSHPAYGMGQAWFQFAFAPGGVVRRLALIEARNPWAVMALERILSHGGAVSEGCSIVSIFRQCPSIGLRSDLVQEMEYADFMIDVVDPDLLLGDPTVATAFRKSLTEAERAYVSAKADMMGRLDEDEAEVESESLAPASVSIPVAVPTTPGPGAERLSSALTGLGFDKRAVKQHVQSLGDRVESDSLPDLIRESLRVLAP